MAAEANPESYDEVPYPSFAHPQSHPDRLATLATVFGLEPVAVPTCRVLEIGCASGGNLIPLAAALPGATIVGIDQSPGQIAAGREIVEALGLRNISLRPMNVLDVTAELGQFDYVIAHGVYSWVPDPVKDKLLAVCRCNLSPRGVAYVSYNTFPGWHYRSALREMMLFHTRNIRESGARAAQGRALVDFLAESVPGESNAYGQMLRREQRSLRDKHDGYLLHDELAGVNDPVYFHRFMDHATRHGLQFLAEAEISTMTARGSSPAVAAALAKLGPDVLAREQYLDFLNNRGFRHTLLCHREITLRHEPIPESARRFQIASRAECVSSAPDLRPGRPEEFRGPREVTVGTDHPLSKAAFVHLAAVWPQALSFEDLQTAARQRLGGAAVSLSAPGERDRDTHLLAENLLQAFLAEVVEFHVQVPPLALEPGPRPKAPDLARYQAGKGNRVTNLRHEVVPLDDVTRFLLHHLDGSRDHADLGNVLAAYVKERGLIVQRQGRPLTREDEVVRALAEGLENQLGQLARSAFLVR